MYLLDTCDNPGTLIMCKTLANVLIRYRPVSLDFIQTNGKPFVRHRRYNGEINEADIHEMSMEDVCLLTQAPEDKVYEALVIGDYIEETSA